MVGIGGANRARGAYEELPGRHPRIVDEGAIDGTPCLLKVKSDLHRVTPCFLGSVIEDLFDTEVCEAVGGVGRVLRITEDRAGDVVLFAIFSGSLRLSWAYYYEINASR